MNQIPLDKMLQISTLQATFLLEKAGECIPEVQNLTMKGDVPKNYDFDDENFYYSSSENVYYDNNIQK